MEASAARRYLLDLNHPDESVRNKAQYTLGDNSVRPKWVPDLIVGVTDGTPRVRFWAATALGRQHEAYAAAVPALIGLLYDPDRPANRSAAAGALADIGPAAAKDAVPALARVLEGDPDRSPREEAVRALGRLWPWNPDAIPVLTRVLEDPDERVRHRAIGALNLLRIRGRSAVPALRRVAAGDPEPSLRDAAAHAVELILAGTPAIRYDEPYHSLSEIAAVARFTDPDTPAQLHELLESEEFARAFGLIEQRLEREQDEVVWSRMWTAAQVLRLPSAGRYGARCEEASGWRGPWSELKRAVRSKSTVAKGLARIVRYHAEIEPDPRWKLFERLPIAEDLARLEAWITAAFTDEPPPNDVPGLWFGLLNVEREGELTLDMHLDAGQLDDEEPHDLVFGGSWTPRNEFAHSEVLDQIHKIAHSDEDSPLADAEPVLSLAYAALAIRWLASTLDPELMLGGALERVLAVGYHDGDSIGVGRLRKGGLSSPKR